MNMAFELKATRLADIALQEASLNIWDTKYRLKTKAGEPVDRDIDGTYERVAKALAAVEEPAKRAEWYERFVWALQRGAIPAGRITSNAGAEFHKPATSTINCTVSGTIQDSMHDILSKVHEAGLTLKAGCGIGYEFSTLRPRGAYVSGAGRVHVRPAVVHGYLRQDVLHGLVRGRPPRRADGHVRRRPPRRDGFHPREARGRPAAAVQSVAADHRRVHGGRQEGPALAARVPGHASRKPRKTASISAIPSRSSGATGRARRATCATSAASSRAASTARCPRGACGT